MYYVVLLSTPLQDSFTTNIVFFTANIVFFYDHAFLGAVCLMVTMTIKFTTCTVVIFFLTCHLLQNFHRVDMVWVLNPVRAQFLRECENITSSCFY